MAIPLRKRLGLRQAVHSRRREPVQEPMQFELVIGDTVQEGAAYRSWGFAHRASTSDYFAEMNARAVAAMKRENVRWT